MLCNSILELNCIKYFYSFNLLRDSAWSRGEIMEQQKTINEMLDKEVPRMKKITHSEALLTRQIYRRNKRTKTRSRGLDPWNWYGREDDPTWA